MAKLIETVQALAGNPATRALAEELQASLGEWLKAEPREVAAGLQEGQQARQQAAELAEKARLSEALQERVAAYEQREHARLLSAEFEISAREAGVRADAVAAAAKLADLSGVKVDLEKNTVTGLGPELFATLRQEHPVLFADQKPASNTIPALPPTGTGAPAPGLEIPGPIGGFLKAARL